MSNQPALTPEVLVPKLGDYLVKKGHITMDQLVEALEQQKLLKDSGKVELLGEILIGKGFIQRKLLDQAITEQIVQLRNGLAEANHTLEQRVIQRTLELQNALNKLSELDKLKSNFISNISHELRTPLTHIKGYQELLLAGAMGQLNPEQVSTVNIIKKSSERLERLIEDLISFSLATKGEVSLKLTPVNIGALVQNVVNHNLIRAEEVKITLKAHVPENLPIIKVDEQKISWVMMQLLDNSLKFTPEKGKINVGLDVQDMGIHISVEDSGIGIPKNKIGEIFEPFHQLDSNSTRRYGGTGLGLTLVKQIIDAHHSHIIVTSELGKFSRFEFTLPIIDHE
jgi:signal transduction histidine kinase